MTPSFDQVPPRGELRVPPALVLLHEQQLDRNGLHLERALVRPRVAGLVEEAAATA